MTTSDQQPQTSSAGTAAGTPGTDGKPMSLGARLIAIALGLGILALAYWMFTNYTLFDGAENVTKGRHALLKWAVSMAWSRPVAVIIGLLGLLIAFAGVVGGKGDDAKAGGSDAQREHPSATVVAVGHQTPVPAAAPMSGEPLFKLGDPAVAAHLERLSRGDQSAQPAFWAALFALPQLHFYSSKPMDKIIAENDASPPLFIGVVEGRPMLHVFSSEKAAHTFGVQRQHAQGRSAEGITTLTMPPEAALGYLWRLPPEVGALIVDSAFFGARTNLPWLYAISKSITVDEACVRIGINPADEMARPGAASAST